VQNRSVVAQQRNGRSPLLSAQLELQSVFAPNLSVFDIYQFAISTL
jgi:hypothetical protein